MKLKYLFLLILFQLFIITANAENKIYYLDMNFIINNSDAGKVILKKIDEFKNKSMEDLKKKEELIKRKQNEFNSQKNILSQDEITTRIKNIEDEVQKFNSERKNLINEYEIKKKKDIEELMKKISPLLEEYMDQNSIDFILNQSSVLISKSKYNLNEKIINLLNEKLN